jgi:hypothetical protein
MVPRGTLFSASKGGFGVRKFNPEEFSKKARPIVRHRFPAATIEVGEDPLSDWGVVSDVDFT